MNQVEPLPATTIVLTKETDKGLEVFLTKRDSRLNFLGGFYVFPGGRVDSSDCELFDLCFELTEKKLDSLIPIKLTLTQKCGHLVAGLRELFEETGVLIASDKNGSLIKIDEKLKKSLDEERKMLQKRKITFREILINHNLFLLTSELIWLAHWITPKTSPKRFDTQFFVCKMPEEQNATIYEPEISEALWISPKKAIELWKAGKMPMIPPTLASLDRLSVFKSWKELKNGL